MIHVTAAAASYKNFELDTSLFSIGEIVIGLYVGVVIAMMISYYSKLHVGGFLRALLKKEALSPDCAQSVGDLEFKLTPLRRFSMKHDASLAKYTKIANEEEAVTIGEPGKVGAILRKVFFKEPKIKKTDLKKAKYYIPKELKYRADVLFDKKGASPFWFVFWFVAFSALAFCVYLLIPEILTMTDNMISILKSKLQ